MKNSLLVSAFALTLLTASCKTDSSEPVPMQTSPTAHLIGKDSIATGSYLGLDINQDAQQVYATIQAKGLSHLNIVQNIAPAANLLQDRIPLYSYILLDENKGTDSGVQITLKSGVIEAIYLNSGTKLTKWPVPNTVKSAFAVGDRAEVLYAKFNELSKLTSYKSKFERIMLLTKDVATSYDPVMAASPQWYFVNKIDPKNWEVVQIHFKNGKISYFKVDRYRDI
jgi:hypothetical protein